MKANSCGTPQGGVISPLLANIYLHPLDEGVNECQKKPRMVRYADDLVILCRPGEGSGMKGRLARWLQSRGLALNEAKTQVLQSRERGFQFLGFSFRWQQSKKGTPYVHTEPSPAAQAALRDKVRELTGHHTTWKETGKAVREINQVTRGWGNYFARANCHRCFGQMNDFIALRLRQWLWRKHGNPPGKYERWPSRALFEDHGLYRLRTAL
jgi:RNA-directed DNA polymerase